MSVAAAPVSFRQGPKKQNLNLSLFPTKHLQSKPIEIGNMIWFMKYEASQVWTSLVFISAFFFFFVSLYPFF